MTYWTCPSCSAANSPGMKRCRCGEPKPVYDIKPEAVAATPAPKRSRKMAKSDKVPRRSWLEVDPKGMTIARRFGINTKEDGR